MRRLRALALGGVAAFAALALTAVPTAASFTDTVTFATGLRVQAPTPTEWCVEPEAHLALSVTGAPGTFSHCVDLGAVTVTPDGNYDAQLWVYSTVNPGDLQIVGADTVPPGAVTTVERVGAPTLVDGVYRFPLRIDFSYAFATSVAAGADGRFVVRFRNYAWPQSQFGWIRGTLVVDVGRYAAAAAPCLADDEHTEDELTEDTRPDDTGLVHEPGDDVAQVPDPDEATETPDDEDPAAGTAPEPGTPSLAPEPEPEPELEPEYEPEPGASDAEDDEDGLDKYDPPTGDPDDEEEGDPAWPGSAP